jgi:DNA-binding MarR family transcriptional regulator
VETDQVAEPAPDLTHLLARASLVTEDAVTERVVAAGFGDLRPGQRGLLGFLASGPVTVHELAERLGITAQGASKAVIELEDQGYVRRRVDTSDRRTRVVELTARGRAGLDATGAARALVSAGLRGKLGDRATVAFERSLRTIAG